MELSTLAIRLALAMLLGGLIGLERQTKHRPAGFRTHILVCTGSALIMCLSEFMFADYSARFGLQLDPTRLGAQVISGIGFLGAGTIINFGASVKGLTTAAGLWSVACIGLAAGAGFYSGAVLTTVLIIVTLLVFSKFSKGLDEAFHVFELVIQADNNPALIGEVTLKIDSQKSKILDMEFVSRDENNIAIKLILNIPPKSSVETLVASLRGVPGVNRIERM